MNDPIELNTIEDMQSVSGTTKVLGYDAAANKIGFISVNQVKQTTWCGCRWNMTQATPVGEPVGSLPKIERMIDLFGLGGYIVHNDHSRQKLSPSNHNLYLTGGTALLDGTHGHYNWGSGVGIYYATWRDGVYEYEAVDTVPIPGQMNYYIPVFSRSCAGYAAIDRTNLKLVNYINTAAQYRGGNNNAEYDGTWCSLLGKPATNIPIATAATYARKNGNLWFANSRVVFFITAVLKRIYFHNRSIQQAYNATLTADNLHQGGTGQGCDLPFTWSDNGNNPYIPLSVGVDRGDFTGLLSTTMQNKSGNTVTVGNIPSFAGLKNDYKYLGAISENMLLRCNADKSQSLFINNDIDGSLMNLDSVAGNVQIATGPVAEAAGWQYAKEYTLKNLSFFPGSELGGSASTFYGDGYYNPAATDGLRAAYLLGRASNGDVAGSLSLSGSDAVSNAAAHLGAFLCEWAEAFTTEPIWCMED